LGMSPVGHAIPDSVINSYPKPGFQNAPNFCDDTDKSLGTYSFNVPPMDDGFYTFTWLWAFNGPQDYYSTCFEVEVVADAATRQGRLQARGQSDFSLPCDDGPTSVSGQPGSMEGCTVDPVTQGPPTTTQPPTQAPTNAPTNAETVAPTQAPTMAPMAGDMGYVLANQMTGKIILPGPQVPAAQREIHVRFFADCVAVARPNFWYARMSYTHDNSGNVLHRFRRHSDDTTESIHYVLIQDNADDINRGYVGFHWAFTGGCRMLQYPTEIHVIDTPITV